MSDKRGPNILPPADDSHSPSRVTLAQTTADFFFGSALNTESRPIDDADGIPTIPDVNEIYTALRQALRRDHPGLAVLAQSIEVDLHRYQFTRSWLLELRGKHGGKDKEKLKSAAYGLREAVKKVANCGEVRKNMLLDAYERDSICLEYDQGILEMPWQRLERDLEGVGRLARLCGVVCQRDIPKRSPPTDAEAVLLARTGLRAMELGVLKRLGVRRTSLFHRISMEVLTLAGLPASTMDSKVSGAVAVVNSQGGF